MTNRGLEMELDRTEVEARLCAHVTEVCVAEDGAIALDDDLLTSGSIDSMGIMELIAFLEETYGIAVDDADIVADNFRSIRAIADFLERSLQPADDPAWCALVAEFRALVSGAVPEQGIVLVVSHGDDDLTSLDGPTAWHFPRDASGGYAGYNPADDVEAVAHVEELRALGATAIAFPASECWWLEHYAGLRVHLQERGRELAQGPAGQVYALCAA
jgi:acyl carrier protein